MIRLVKIEDEEGLDEVRMLFKEYLEELNENLCFQSTDEELISPLKKYGPPSGSLFLAYWKNEPAGCIALQPLKEEGVCEMKRLFVRPGYRNHSIGSKLIEELLSEGWSCRTFNGLNLHSRYLFKNRRNY